MHAARLMQQQLKTAVLVAHPTAAAAAHSISVVLGATRLSSYTAEHSSANAKRRFNRAVQDARTVTLRLQPAQFKHPLVLRNQKKMSL
jgi:hypothetical protein